MSTGFLSNLTQLFPNTTHATNTTTTTTTPQHRSVASILTGSTGVGPSGASSTASSLTSSTALKHKVLKTTPVILDLGDEWIKIGFAGETAPRHILSTRQLILSCRSRLVDPQLQLHTQDQTATTNNHTLTPEQLRIASTELSTSRAFVLNPYHTGVGWYTILSAVLRSLYFHTLHVNPKDRRILILENVGWSHTFKRALIQALYEMEVPAVGFRPGVECALYCSMPLQTPTTGLGNAFMIDVGWNETRMLPIYLGYPLTHLMRCVPLGMWDVIQRFRSLTRTHLRMEYAQVGGDTNTRYYREQEERILSIDQIENTISTMAYVQPFQLALDAHLNEMKSKGVNIEALTSSTNSPPPLPHIPSSNAASTLPPPLPFPFLLNATAPPGSVELTFPPTTSASAPAPNAIPPLPPMISLPALIRHDIFETLFSFDRAALSTAASDILQESSTNTARGSTSELSLTESLIDILLDSKLPPEIRGSLLSNLIMMGGTAMVSGFTERFNDEVNWLLGGNTPIGGHGKFGKGIDALKVLQNKLSWNPCSSAISSRPYINSMNQSMTPFASNLLAWIGGSLYGCLDVVDEEFYALSELKQFLKGRQISKKEINARQKEGDQRRHQSHTDGEGKPVRKVEEEKTSLIPNDLDENQQLLLRPLTFPDWSHPTVPTRVRPPPTTSGVPLGGVGGHTSTLSLSSSFTANLNKHRTVSSLIGSTSTPSIIPTTSSTSTIPEAKSS